MAFINYQKVANKFISEQMKKNINTLKDFDVFHCLLDGDEHSATAVTKRVKGLPDQFINWIEVCNGGLLFDTVMLSTKSYDYELELPFDTYGEYFNIDLRKEYCLSDNWFVFAHAIHSDVYFFDMDKSDGQVYQWDVENFEIYAIWQTFNDWLTYLINEAVEMIAEEELEPLDVKLEFDCYE